MSSVIDLSPFNTILARLESVAERLERGAVAGHAETPGASFASVAAPADDPAIALAFDAFTQEKLGPVQAAAEALGEKDLLEATETFCRVFSLVRDLLVGVGMCRKPQDADWAKLLAPVLELGQQAHKACDNRSDFFHHRKSAAEALNLATFVTATSPPNHVQNVLETMDFHAIKVMQKKNTAETAWVKALKEAVKELKDWCTENCKLGLIWNPQGEDPKEYFEARPLGAGRPAPAAAKGAGKGGKGPAPPKAGLSGPPPELVAKMRAEAGYPNGLAADAAPTTPAAPAAGMAAVFGAIGAFSTGALRKVTADMKSKNQPKDDTAVVPASKAAPAKAAPAVPGRARGKGPRGSPLIELQKDVNWVVENYENVADLTLDNAGMQHLVAVINCRNITLRINSTKVKSITIDGCERVNVIFNDVVSVVELVNSDQCKVQTTGKVNSFAIDKCNGVHVYLSKESLKAEFVTSKSSEMNVTIPDEGGDDLDTIELPIPEQFVTTIVGPKKLKTEVSSLYTS